MSPTLVALLATAAVASSPPNPEDGKKVFSACAACHDAGHAHKVGPGLAGVVGRKAGTVPGFRFSGPMRRSGITWGADTLDRYLADPQKAVPGNTMPYPGLPDPGQRADLIAYLETLR